MSDVTGFQKRPGTPGVHVSGCNTSFSTDKNELLSKKLFTVGVLIIAGLLSRVHGEAPGQMKGRSMSVIAGTCHVFLMLMDALPFLNCPIMRL